MHMKHRTLMALALASCAVVPSSSFAQCRHSKCSIDLQTAPEAPLGVIIQYKEDTNEMDAAKVIALAGGFRTHLHGVHSIAATLTPRAIELLAADDKITHISIDHKVVSHSASDAGVNVALVGGSGQGLKGGLANSSPSVATSPEFTAEPINAPQVWALGYDGTGIGVAVIDSGVNQVADLQGQRGSRVVYSQSFVAGELKTTSDAFGHGTHVAGLIGGNGASSNGKLNTRTFLGIAPNVNIINLRVLDENGAGTDSQVIAGIQRAIALKNTYNIRVINLSLGRGIYESYTLDPLCQAVEQAWKAGIVVVVSAGNEGRNNALNAEAYGTIDAPGNDPYVLTVGAVRTVGTATNTDDAMASYSSKGPSFVDQVAKPDVVAPGNLVTSLLARTSNLQTNNPSFYTPLSFYNALVGLAGANLQSSVYMPLSGTSMATGVASGAVALLLQAQPSLNPDQAKASIMLNANKTILPQMSSVTDPSSNTTYVDYGDVFTVGAGYLDINASVANVVNVASLPAGTAMSPIARFATDGSNTVTLVNDATALWGQSTASGNTTATSASAVYGSNAFVTGNTALWGQTALWGASDPKAYTALWGQTAMWGQTALWGQGTPAGATALWGQDSSSAQSTMTSER